MGRFSNYYEKPAEDKERKLPDESSYYCGAEGECDLEIIKAEKTVSTSGNPQLVVDFKATDKNGKVGKMRDWFPELPTMAWKTANLLFSIGREDLNTPEGFEPEDLDGCTAKGVLKSDRWQRKDGIWITSSKIAKYIPCAKDKSYKITSTKAEDDSADELPF